MSDARLEAAIAEFDALTIEYAYTEAWVDRAFAMARRFGHANVFDAIYLACAEDLDAELWTADRTFVASFGRERPPRLRLCPDDLPD